MENAHKNIIANVTRRKVALKKEKTDLDNTFIPTGMPRVTLDKYFMTRVATNTSIQKQQDDENNQYVKRKTR